MSTLSLLAGSTSKGKTVGKTEASGKEKTGLGKEKAGPSKVKDEKNASGGVNERASQASASVKKQEGCGSQNVDSKTPEVQHIDGATVSEVSVSVVLLKL